MEVLLNKSDVRVLGWMFTRLYLLLVTVFSVGWIVGRALRLGIVPFPWLLGFLFLPALLLLAACVYRARYTVPVFVLGVADGYLGIFFEPAARGVWLGLVLPASIVLGFLGMIVTLFWWVGRACPPS